MDEDDRKQSKKALEAVHARAIKRFDLAYLPQADQRAESLEARRFVSIRGAQWEGDWAEPFDNALKLEIDSVGKGVEKIVRDYNENRIVPDFRPAGNKGDADSANALDGIHRADDYRFKSQQARDNAFVEAAQGGFGAYRLSNEWDDELDADNDFQRINPAVCIPDADQSVFFDPDAILYDKSDAKYAFVRVSKSRAAFEEEFDGAISEWSKPETVSYDWFDADKATVAEYYEVETRDEKLLILTHAISKEERREWEGDFEDGELADLRKAGWRTKSQKRKRKRVRKYVLSGAEVLEDCGYIAGTEIPIVPVYGKRWFVEGVERFEGYVQKKMDAQRLYNSNVSRLAETNAQSPREIPIFATSQMPPHIQALWERQVIDRHAYALVDPLIDPTTGQILASGPIGTLNAPQVEPATAALLQISKADLTDDQQDGAETVRANTSEEAMQVAAARVDAKSGIYLDNMRQSVQREGEIYLSMCPDVYFEKARKAETMTEDGDDGEVELRQLVTGPNGEAREANNFSRGAYKVIASVAEATATRRDRTVKQMLSLAELAISAQDMELTQAALTTATLNMDGEGLDDFLKWNRSRALQIGLVEPTDEERQQMEQAAAAQSQPDPVVESQVEALKAGAAKDMALAGKAEADTSLSEAKRVEALASAAEKASKADGVTAGQAIEAMGGPAPYSPTQGE